MALGPESTTHPAAISSASSQSWSHTITVANKLIVSVCLGDNILANRQVASVTYNGVSLTQVVEADDGIFNHVELWQLHNPSAGTNTVVVTLDFSCSQMACGSTGIIDAAVAVGTGSANFATETNPSVTVVDSASGDMVVSALMSDLGPTGTMTENGVLLWEEENIFSDTDANVQRQTAAGANTVCGWTGGSADWYAAVGFAVKAGAGPDTKASYSQFPKHNLAASRYEGTGGVGET